MCSQMTDKPIRIRVAAVIRKGDRFLFVKLTMRGSEFWILPGGGLEFRESLAECLVRELKEEADIDVKPEKIIYIRDLVGKEEQGLEVFFYATIVGGKVKRGIDPDPSLNHTLDAVSWMTLVELDNVKFFPVEIKPLLHKIIESNDIPECCYGGKHFYEL